MRTGDDGPISQDSPAYDLVFIDSLSGYWRWDGHEAAHNERYRLLPYTMLSGYISGC